MACFQKSLPTERENEQAIAILKKGAYLLKYGRRGKPKFCPFRLSSDEIFLLWYCGKKEKRLKLSSVSKIIPGQRTAVFRRYPQPTKEYQSFSLIYGDRSLDLVCKDKDEAEFWITTLRALLSRNSSSALVLHSRSRSFVPDYGEESCSTSNIRTVSSDTSCEEHAKKASGSHVSTPQRLGKVFSEVLSQTAVLRALSLDELVHKPHNSSPETLDNNHSPAVDTCKYSVSSAVSSSSQGSSFQDLKCLCDVFVWGESIGEGLLGGGMQKSGSSSSLMTDSFLPKVLKSHVALDAQSISCGTDYAVLVTKQGQIYSWGEESGGRLGHGVSSYVPQPKLIDEFYGSTVELADCGEFHTCAVTASGDLYAWGDGAHHAGLLGLGSEASHWKPVRILGQMEGVNVKTISCGPWHTAFVTSEGKLFTFGDGTFGALGHGDRVSTNVPREVEALSGCRTIKTACGVWHSAAVVATSSSSGKLFTWGDGEDGKLGHGDKESRLIPSCVTELDTTNFQQVACGQSITIALSASGHVYSMGIADPSHDNVVRAPCCIEGGLGKSFVQEVACGFHHVAVLNSKAEVYTWGRGSNGQLGHGDTEYRRMPTLVKALKGKQVRKVVCGSNYTATICLHKPISGTDSSRCSGCRHPFNYMRKLHNCYNCGSVFCNSCTSKKSLAAAMAPKTNRPYRVCDDCYIKLEGVREYLGTPANSARFSNASLPSSCNEMDEIGTTPQHQQLLRVDSFDFFRQSKIPDLKTIGETSGASCNSSIHSSMDIKGSFNLRGIRRLSRLTSFDSVNQEGKQRTKHCASKSDTSSLIRHSVTAGLPFSRRGSVELFPLSVKSSPVESVATTSDFTTDITDTELLQEGSKKPNQCLNQEISVLKAQVEELTRKSKQLETELGTSTKRLEVAVLMARDDAEKIKSSEKIIRSLTLQLMDATKKEVDKTRRCRSSF